MLKIILVGAASSLFKKVEQYYFERLKPLIRFEKVEVFEKREKMGKMGRNKSLSMGQKINEFARGKVYLTIPNAMEINDDFLLNLVKTSLFEDVSIVVGGPFGIPEDVAGQKISFSKLTFPHDLFRIILVEQIYRQALNLKGTDYKK
jgi:23S rRNA (pseudouridine1915-N3)-methyltransferase